jgi:hypothetical protein
MTSIPSVGAIGSHRAVKPCVPPLINVSKRSSIARAAAHHRHEQARERPDAALQRALGRGRLPG